VTGAVTDTVKGILMLDDGTVERLAHHWETGWNRRDLDLIMEPFADDIVFSSPYVVKQLGDRAHGTVKGHDDLRAYVAAALERAGDVRYTLRHRFAGTDSVILLYTCHLPGGGDREGADFMRVGGQGKVVEWRSHYDSDPTAWRA
jgi:ketosteroid isomerase-like protein